MAGLKFYVYLHIDPESKEIVYVGKGCGGRAWDVTRNRRRYANEKHLEYLNSLIDKGYLPTDWVHILYRGLSEQEALQKEKEFLYTQGTLKFNNQSGERNYQAKLQDKEAIFIYEQCKHGASHKDLALKFNVSRSCISMIASEKQWKAAIAKYKRENATT